MLRPRALVTCTVEVTNLLDLRSAGARASAGLSTKDLASPTDDRAGYVRCQAVARVAHQLRLHGLVAPAATAMGKTLVLFTDILPASQHPRLVDDPEMWARLPADARRPDKPALRVVGPNGAP